MRPRNHILFSYHHQPDHCPLDSARSLELTSPSTLRSRWAFSHRSITQCFFLTMPVRRNLLLSAPPPMLALHQLQYCFLPSSDRLPGSKIFSGIPTCFPHSLVALIVHISSSTHLTCAFALFEVDCSTLLSGVAFKTHRTPSINTRSVH